MLYDSGDAFISSNDIHLADLRVALVTDAYTPDPAHNRVSDLTGELSGGNYERRPLQGVRQVGDALVAGDVLFADLEAVAGQPRYAVLYVERQVDADRTLIAVYDLGAGAAIPRGTGYFIRWPARGLVTGI